MRCRSRGQSTEIVSPFEHAHQTPSGIFARDLQHHARKFGEIGVDQSKFSQWIAEPRIERLLPAPPQPDAAANLPPALRQRGNHWLLAMFVDPASEDDRGNAVWLQSALAQYGDRNLDGAIICASRCENLPHEWHLPGVQVVEGKGSGTVLVSPQGKVVARWNGFVPPAEFGLAVRWHVGGWRPPTRK